MRKQYFINKMLQGAEGLLELPYEKATEIQKVLVDKGYCVLMSCSECKDTYKVQWVYGGDYNHLEIANSDNILFCQKSYLEELIKSLDEKEEEF